MRVGGSVPDRLPRYILRLSSAVGCGTASIRNSSASTNEPKNIAELCATLDALPEGESRLPLLIELLNFDGHERHEDIVFELGVLGNSSAVPAIAQAISGCSHHLLTAINRRSNAVF